MEKEDPLALQENSKHRLRQLLKSYYEILDSKTEREFESKGRVNGFCEALILSGQADTETLQDLLNNEHVRYFGFTREARYYKAVNSDQAWSERDWGRFDEPTFMRRPLRCKRK